MVFVSANAQIPGGGRGIEPLLAVSRAVARGGDLETLLNVIAAAAAEVVGAQSASILLLREKGSVGLAAAFNLSPRYCAYLQRLPIDAGYTPSALVLRGEAPVLIEDAGQDPRLGEPRVAPEEARREGYRAMASVPLDGPQGLLGVLHVYRRTVGPWPPEQVELLMYFAEHAANAYASARLLDHSKRQVSALSQLVRGLRHQTHEYANRLHVISGLLALGEHQELERFVAGLEVHHHRSYEAVLSRIDHLALAGLLLAQMAVAQQRGITLTLDARSRLDALPDGLADDEAITILGNLIDNAFAAVSTMPRTRRRVRTRLTRSQGRTVFEVRDWGSGLDPEVRDRLFDSGVTTKAGHPGIGLSLVAAAAAAALGHVEVHPQRPGTLFRVTVPDA